MKNLFKIAVLLFSMGTIGTIQGQESDLSTKIEYTYFPQSESDNSFRRFRVRINYPFKLGERAYIIPGIEYRNVELQYGDAAPFPTKDLERFQSFTARLTYTFGMKNDWRFAARGGLLLTSNFALADIIDEDLVYIGGIYFIRDRSEKEVDLPWRIVFGIRYSTRSGRPFPLPVINYFHTINDHLEYTLGVPTTKLTYFFQENNAFTAFAKLDGFYANIQNPVAFEQHGSIKHVADITMTVVLAGLGYEHYFTEHLLIFGYAGYTLYNDIRLRNENKDDIYTINENNSFYGRVGIEFKL